MHGTHDDGFTNADVGSIDFCTLAMFIIDDIYPPPDAEDQTPQINVIGGAGTYSALGARLFSPPPLSRSVGWIVDCGTDFPQELRSLIDSWKTSVLLRPRDALTTRGWNGYGESEHRGFKYLTEKKRLTADDLTPELLRAKSFHLICSSTRCVDMVTRIHERRSKSNSDDLKPPWIIWEPVPDLCIPDELENAYKAASLVDVISPNHDELGGFFGFQHTSGINKQAAQRQANEFLARGVGTTNDGAVVVRLGREGVLVASLDERKWLPAYHQDSTRVVDPTGGGNGFLGGFAVGLVRTQNVVEAARWGSVAASFCIEQVGMPTLTTVVSTSTCTDELWNDESVDDRHKEYRERTSCHEMR
jgi:sugar/nucleoside kinase (ribokinase family)